MAPPYVGLEVELEEDRHDHREYQARDSPVAEVRSIVATVDDPETPTLTIRMWVLGLISCAAQSYLRTVAMFVENPFDLPLVITQILTYFVGQAMAAILPDRLVYIPGTDTALFSLNPGLFSQKEHFLICVFSYIGHLRPLFLQTPTVSKGYFHKEVYVMSGFFGSLSSFLICLLFVGLFWNWVSSPSMWWPSNLADVMLFRALHERNNDLSARYSNRQLFALIAGWSFAYLFMPSFFFWSISSILAICWFLRNSITVQQVGGGQNGLGLLAFIFDWPVTSDFTGDAPSTTFVVLCNFVVALFVAFYVVVPAVYWSYAYKTQQIPMSWTEMYNISGVLDADGLTFNEGKYKGYTPIHLGAYAIVSLCFMMASAACIFVHVAVTYGSDIWKELNHNVHNILMKSYKLVRRTWFVVVSALAFSVAIIGFAMGFGPKLFSISVIIMSCVVALPLVVPVGIYASTTNQIIPASIICSLLGGLLYANKPLDFMVFSDFTYQTVINVVYFLGIFKLGHYAKVAYRAMFAVVIVASITSLSVSYGVAWYFVETHKNACSQGCCPSLDIFYGTTNMWVIVATYRIIIDGNYTPLLLSLLGVSLVTEALLLYFARQWTFLTAIGLSIILGVTHGVPPASITTWLVVGIAFSYVAGCFVLQWSPKHRYILSVAILAGVGATIVIRYIIENGFHITSPEWWGSKMEDHCPLAKFPK